MRMMDRVAGVLVCLIGLAHLLVGWNAFLSPSERGVWFLSAGFLLITTGLANLGASDSPSRLHSAAALSGCVAILVIGALLAGSDSSLLFAPQTVLLVGLGLFLLVMRLRTLVPRTPRP